MKTKREKEYALAQIKKIVEKKIKTFTKEYVDSLDDNEVIIIPLIALEQNKQINLGKVELLGKNVKEIYYDQELSVKATMMSEVKRDNEIYIERPEKVDNNTIVLERRNKNGKK